MPVPKHIFDPPFNIIRASHAVLDVVDLDASRFTPPTSPKLRDPLTRRPRFARIPTSPRARGEVTTTVIS